MSKSTKDKELSTQEQAFFDIVKESHTEHTEIYFGHLPGEFYQQENWRELIFSDQFRRKVITELTLEGKKLH